MDKIKKVVIILLILLFIILAIIIALINSQLIISSTPYKEMSKMIAKEYSDILFNNLRDTLINTKLKEFSNETILVQNVVLKTSVYNQNIEPYCNLKQSQIVIAVDPIRMYFEFDYTKVGTEETKTYYFMVDINYLLIDEIELYKNVSVYFTLNNFQLGDASLKDLIQTNFVKENYKIIKTAIENCLISNLQSNKKNNIKYDINKSIGTYHGEISLKTTKFCKDIIGEENGVLCYYDGTTNDNSVQYREDFLRFSSKEAHKNKLYINYKVFDDIISHLPSVWNNISFTINSNELSFLTNNDRTDKIKVNLVLTNIHIKSSNKLQTEMIATLSKEDTNEKILQVKLSTEYTYTFIKKLYFLNLKVTGYNVMSNKVDILYSSMNINVNSLLYDYNTFLSSIMSNKEPVLLDKGLKLNQFFLLIEEMTTDKSGVYLQGEFY